MKVAVERKRQAGGVVVLTLLWLIGIAAIFYVCALRNLPGIQTKLIGSASAAIAGAGVAGANVALDGRDAVLSGEVSSQDEISAAVFAVQKLDGIRQVQNELRVAADLRAPEFSLQMSDAGIALFGLVPSEDSAALLVEGVQQSFPSYQLDNNIFVDESTAEPIWLETTLSSLSALKQAENISLDIEGNAVTAGGMTSTPEMKQSIEQSLISTFSDPLEVTSNIQVLEAVSLKEPTLELTLFDRELTLAGQVRSTSDVEILAGSVMSSFDLDLVNNQLTINPEVSEALWLDSMATLLPQLNSFDTLEISIKPDSASINGQTTDPDTRDKAIAQIDNTIGKLLPIDTQITAKTQTETDTNSAETSQSETVSASAETAQSETDTDTTETAQSETDTDTTETAQSGAATDASADTPANALLTTAVAEPAVDSSSVETNPPATVNQTAETLVTSETDASAQVESEQVDSKQTSEGSDANNTQRRAALKTALENFDISSIGFRISSAVLTDDSKLLLARIAVVLKQFQDVDIDVHGFTDSVGDQQTNLSLSQARADAVVSYLLENEVDAERLSAQGYGAADPVADNTTPEGRARNRRIEFNY